eukprot:scaffold474623_cov36-Prasinocladus_malaysianus.AAC.4
MLIKHGRFALAYGDALRVCSAQAQITSAASHARRSRGYVTPKDLRHLYWQIRTRPKLAGFNVIQLCRNFGSQRAGSALAV